MVFDVKIGIGVSGLVDFIVLGLCSLNIFCCSYGIMYKKGMVSGVYMLYCVVDGWLIGRF